MKIGQQVEFKKDFKINTIISDKVKTVKEGDVAFLDSKALLHIITGNGKGKIVKVDGIEVNGYDHENIAKLVFNRLSNYFNLDELLQGEDIEQSRFIEEIEDVLMDIL